MRKLIVILVVLALAGCGAQQKSADVAATAQKPAPAGSAGLETTAPAPEAGPGGEAVATGAPRMIEELISQTSVYECPKCGMDFDAAGKCSMDGADLVATRVDYTCPQDGQAVPGAGKCPRCPMNARVQKTAMAAAAVPDKH
jgi:uncharacterized C2H2 Zn-finger protein